MKPPIFLAAIPLILGAKLTSPVQAQEERTLSHVYEAYYKIPYSDLAE